jgi:hypothetical protein
VHAGIAQVIELAANSKSASVDKRSIIWSMLIMTLAGDFVGKTLSWDKQKGLWDGSRGYLRNTNIDIIIVLDGQTLEGRPQERPELNNLSHWFPLFVV